MPTMLSRDTRTMPSTSSNGVSVETMQHKLVILDANGKVSKPTEYAQPCFGVITSPPKKAGGECTVTVSGKTMVVAGEASISKGDVLYNTKDGTVTTRASLISNDIARAGTSGHLLLGNTGGSNSAYQTNSDVFLYPVGIAMNDVDTGAADELIEIELTLGGQL